MEITEQIFAESVSSYQDTMARFKKTGFPLIRAFVEQLAACFKNEGKVLLIGNGGSAADCQHIAGELVGRFDRDRPPLPAISLASDSSVLTCIANDYDYESLFARQLKALAAPQDLVWALSTSGSSANILKAVEAANGMNLTVLSFTGKRNSPLEKISDHCLCAGTEHTDHAQQIHQLAYHIICRYLDELYAE